MQTLDERLDARMQHLRTKFDGSDDVREAQQLLAHHDELQNMSAADEDRIHTIIQGMSLFACKSPRCSCLVVLTWRPSDCTGTCNYRTPLANSADDAVYVYAGMQREVEQAQAAATPPDPAVHTTSVQQLQTECRESSVRVTSLENEARYAQPLPNLLGKNYRMYNKNNSSSLVSSAKTHRS